MLSTALMAATLAFAAAGKDWKPEYELCRSIEFGNLTVVDGEAIGAWSVFTADLDGDGDIDPMSASFDDNTIAWYRNDGGSPPTFEKKIIATDALSAYAVRSADMDDDGDMDVLSASLLDLTIALYTNDGTGSFAKSIIADDLPGARSVEVGDINGDGIPDVAAAGSEADQGSMTDGSVVWYASSGGSPLEWTKQIITTDAPGQRGIVIADLDGDGDLDVGANSRLDGTVAMYANDDGKGSAWTKVVASNTTNNAYGIAACDLDLDGVDDIISASPELAEIAWFKFEEDGAFSKYVIYDGALGAFRVTCGDVDGDGDYDVFSADNEGNTIGFYENKCTTPKRTWSESEDGDEWEEKPSCRRNQKVPKFEAHIITSILDTPRSVALGDLDGDGFLDLLSASVDDDTVAWYQNKC